MAAPSPARALTATGGVGATGGTAGTIATLGRDAGDAPRALSAVTVKVYAVPSTRPVHAAEVPVTMHGAPSGDDAMTYPVMGEPLGEGAVQMRLAVVSPAVAVGAAGVSGTPPGVTAALASDGSEAPMALIAVTVNVYAVPFTRPLHTAFVPEIAHAPLVGVDATT